MVTTARATIATRMLFAVVMAMKKRSDKENSGYKVQLDYILMSLYTARFKDVYDLMSLGLQE